MGIMRDVTERRSNRASAHVDGPHDDVAPPRGVGVRVGVSGIVGVGGGGSGDDDDDGYGERGSATSAASAASWRRAVAESAAAVVGRRGCCMSHVVRRLLQGLGVNPTVCDVDDEANGADAAALAEEFARIGAGEVSLPAVFIGGRLMGGLDRLMALHISGELVPMLKQAGALWL
uniref:Glutaredoxin domain-containing protein n=1 Tax=Ananas comosus var. bracteatus TaxID=296719 RepID=A0A6V7NYV8_ANACO|nr:unnamed protein product [Ananas comosus var. bracteatus]